jgi:hypothetical protein
MPVTIYTHHHQCIDKKAANEFEYNKHCTFRHGHGDSVAVLHGSRLQELAVAWGVSGGGPLVGCAWGGGGDPALLASLLQAPGLSAEGSPSTRPSSFAQGCRL